MVFKGEIIAYHGWGFNQSCWKDWQKILANGFDFKSYDRGYFGEKNLVKFDDDQKKKIIFAHSYGLHLCPSEQLEKTDLLVLFNSFEQFHPTSEKFKKRSEYALQLIIAEFKENPQKVLNNFYKKCYYPLPYIARQKNNINLNQLEADLQALSTSQINLQHLKQISKIYIIHGANNPIIYPFQAQEFARKLMRNSQYYEIKDTGHTLPFTHTNLCLPIINQALGEITNYGND